MIKLFYAFAFMMLAGQALSQDVKIRKKDRKKDVNDGY
jgi:hypothetical protein